MNDYCFGLVKVGTRPVLPEESAYVRSLLNWAERRRKSWRIGAWLSPVIFVVSLAGANSSPVLFVISVASLVIALPVLVLLARDSKKRIQVLMEAVKELEVEEYREDDEWLARLPGTGMIVGSSHGTPPGVTTVEKSTVGERPASRDSIFPAEIETYETQTSELRQLSPQEGEELRGLTDRWTPRIKWHQWVLMVYFAAVGVGSLAVVREHQGWIVRGILFTGFAAFSGYTIFRVRKERDAFLRDIERNVVAKVESEGNHWEILPESGLIWTQDGKPTPPRTGSHAPSRI